MTTKKACCGECKCKPSTGTGAMGDLKPDPAELKRPTDGFRTGERATCIATGETGKVVRKTWHLVFVEMPDGTERGFRPKDLKHASEDLP